ncbi:MAG: hypothetical protein JO148_06610 [Acidimicrobiia bacterium]|nr:hypothetical protein [Acidimicrobiia bacterium]
MNRLLRIGIAALAVPATALVLSPASAPAQTSPQPSVVLKLGARAPLSSTGKLIKVKVNITCNNAKPAPIHATVSQNRGSVTAHGSGQSTASYKCNGRTQTGVVPVTADAGSRFHTGGASATADVTITGVDGTTTVSGHDDRNIQLT